MSGYPPCADCGAPVKLRSRDLCHIRHRKAVLAALKCPCPRCGRVRHLRPAGICAICDRPAGSGRPVKTIACHQCGQQRRNAGHGLCNRCKLADPDWPFRYAASLAARLPAVPSWWDDLAAFTAARYHPGGAVAILRQAGRMLAADPAASPRQLMAGATRAGGTPDAAGRALTVSSPAADWPCPAMRPAAGPASGGAVSWPPSQPGWPAPSPRSATASSASGIVPAGLGGARSATSPWKPGCGSCATCRCTWPLPARSPAGPKSPLATWNASSAAVRAAATRTPT